MKEELNLPQFALLQEFLMNLKMCKDVAVGQNPVALVGLPRGSYSMVVGLQVLSHPHIIPVYFCITEAPSLR